MYMCAYICTCHGHIKPPLSGNVTDGIFGAACSPYIHTCVHVYVYTHVSVCIHTYVRMFPCVLWSPGSRDFAEYTTNDVFEATCIPHTHTHTHVSLSLYYGRPGFRNFAEGTTDVVFGAAWFTNSAATIPSDFIKLCLTTSRAMSRMCADIKSCEYM
jgi:hypothetical protein